MPLAVFVQAAHFRIVYIVYMEIVASYLTLSYWFSIKLSYTIAY